MLIELFITIIFDHIIVITSDRFINSVILRMKIKFKGVKD